LAINLLMLVLVLAFPDAHRRHRFKLITFDRTYRLVSAASAMIADLTLSHSCTTITTPAQPWLLDLVQAFSITLVRVSANIGAPAAVDAASSGPAAVPAAASSTVQASSTLHQSAFMVTPRAVETGSFSYQHLPLCTFLVQPLQVG
jgi:hypothetical protein